MAADHRKVFIENKLNFLKGQSSKMKHFAAKSFASLASTEVSIKARNEVVEQSKILCEDYIYNRLANMLHLQQERYLQQTVGRSQHSQTSVSSDSTTDTPNNNSSSNNNNNNGGNNFDFMGSIGRFFSRSDQTQEVFIQSSPDKVGLIRFEKWRNRLPETSSEFLDLGQKLENAYPFLYDNLSAQLKMPLRSEAAITRAMTCVGDTMFDNGFVTWYRIVAMLAVAGAVALEVVDNRRGDLIGAIVQVFSQIVDRHVALWVCRQGGWVAIVPDYQPNNKTYQKVLKIFGFCVGLFIAIMMPITIFHSQ